MRLHAAPSVWEPRYRHIREFERALADEGTTIVKVFLNISKDPKPPDPRAWTGSSSRSPQNVTGFAASVSSTSRNSDLGMATAPIDVRWSVGSWQSISSSPRPTM